MYDLWLLGPNGYHRSFAGNVSLSQSGAGACPEIQVCYEVVKGDIYLHLSNSGKSFCTLTATPDPVYRGAAQGATPGNQCNTAELHWSLQTSGGWYDIAVTSSHDPQWMRRFAGRVETGRDTITDPAM